MAATSWAAPAEAWPQEWLPVLDVPEPGRQRRLTVLVRLLLLIPQFIVLWVLAIAAVLTVIVGWFAALVLGRLPEPNARFLTAYVGYEVRVAASATLLVDRYPPFALRPPPDYPVQIELRPNGLNRLAVLFRLILMIPAAIIQALVSGGWAVAGFVIWLIVLVLGRMPRPLFEATSAILRYRMRYDSYVMMLTSAYPKRLFGDEPRPDGEVRSATSPLLISGAGRALIVLFLVLGLFGDVGSGFGRGDHMNNNSSSSSPAVSTGAR
jgi:hypothetical protein